MNRALPALLLCAGLLAACASHPRPTPLAATASPPPGASGRPEGQGAPPGAPIESQPLPGTAQDFVINVGDRVYFDYDQFDIRSDAAAVLAAQAAWLTRYPDVRVRIEGNCDERGTREYNFALGARRAAAVRDFLAVHGVDSARISTVSYGKERPIDPGNGEAAWMHNRNAHTNIVSGARVRSY